MAVSHFPVPRVESIGAQIGQTLVEVHETFRPPVNSLDAGPAAIYATPVFARLLVSFYDLVHGRLHLPGAGWLIRALAPHFRSLQQFPLAVPGLGTTVVDFRDLAVMGLLNFRLGEHGANRSPLHCAAKFLRPGMVLWDIGANVGTWTAYFAAPRFGLKSIEVFEPNPNLGPVLQSLFAPLPQVHLHRFGLGEKDATCEMQLGSDSSLASLKQPPGGHGIVRVAVRPGDAAVAQLGLPLPDLVKIDVEGFEVEVFAGLRQTIQTQRPVILFEYLFLTDEEIRRLVPERYQLLLLLDDGRLTGDLTLRALGHDAALIPQERLHELNGPGRDV